jgi:hypothetical protein
MYTSGWPKNQKRCRNRVGSPPHSGLKNDVPKLRSVQQQQEGRHQDRPGEQRHAVQRHAGSPHVEDRGDEVDGAQDRGGASDVQREDREIHARTLAQRQRRVDRPAGPDAAADHRRGEQQDEGRRQQPEADVVHARKGHVGRADHQRHEPVAEPADQRRHDDEEHHDQAVRRDDGVPQVTVRRAVRTVEVLDAGLQQFEAHDHREGGADQRGEDREHKVHRADVLVVGAVQPALDARRRMMVVVGVIVVGGAVRGGHFCLSCGDALSGWRERWRKRTRLRARAPPPSSSAPPICRRRPWRPRAPRSACSCDCRHRSASTGRSSSPPRGR